MDFSTLSDGEFKWVIQGKCPFLRYILLDALEDKTAESACVVLKKWFGQIGLPAKLQFDNGNEFKGAVSELAKQLGIRIIRGRPYHPQTQGSIERANRTFKKRLTAFQLAKGTS
jgi:transposase InsO family protein